MSIFEKSISGLTVEELWKLLTKLNSPFEKWKREVVVQELHRKVRGAG